MALKSHGITTETVKNMILSAGVIYKNLKYAQDGGWTGEVLGATSGGIKFHHEVKWLDVEVDGATVLVKGVSKQKVGESASLEGAVTEYSPGILTNALHLKKDVPGVGVPGETDKSMDKYVSKDNIDDSDYLENIAYVGKLSSGKNIIIILPNALCTEAFEQETKNAEQTTFAVKFECTADSTSDALNKLPLEVYYPTAEA